MPGRKPASLIKSDPAQPGSKTAPRFPNNKGIQNRLLRMNFFLSGFLFFFFGCLLPYYCTGLDGALFFRSFPDICHFFALVLPISGTFSIQKLYTFCACSIARTMLGALNIPSNFEGIEKMNVMS
jgi:hypothetical protein